MATCPYCLKKITSLYVGSWGYADDEDSDEPGSGTGIFINETGECPECGADVLLADLIPVGGNWNDEPLDM